MASEHIKQHLSHKLDSAKENNTHTHIHTHVYTSYAVEKGVWRKPWSWFPNLHQIESDTLFSFWGGEEWKWEVKEPPKVLLERFENLYPLYRIKELGIKKPG